MERKEAIEIVRKNFPDSGFTMLREALETLIPELQNEDERIKKTLIRLFTSENVAEQYYGVTCKQIIAWLEKQGEQKSHWKPTKEQIEALNTVRNSHYVEDIFGDDVLYQITSLCNDLEKF